MSTEVGAAEAAGFAVAVPDTCAISESVLLTFVCKFSAFGTVVAIAEDETAMVAPKTAGQSSRVFHKLDIFPLILTP